MALENRIREMVAVLCLALALPAAANAAQQPPAPAPVPEPVSVAEWQSLPDEPALAPFIDAVARYIGLRVNLRNELPGLVVTTRAADISEISDALAGAIERARRGARQGDFFEPAVARVMRQRLEHALRGADVSWVFALSDPGDPAVPLKPGIHVRFPGPAMLATMPIAVLEALPALPPELEYRFVGNVLVLRDIDAALILDYISPALTVAGR